MEKLNVFIVADNALVVNGLKHYLKNKFGEIDITNFYDSRSCLKKINEKTQIVVIDHFIHGRSGMDTLMSIKTINPHTEVIMHTSGEDVASYLDLYRLEKERMLKQKAN